MTDNERYSKRREYFRAYAKANAAKRKEANRRWRENNKDAYNARQKANNERWRRAHGIKPRPPAKPKPIKIQREPKPKPIQTPVISAQPKLISVPREIEGVSARFAAYRAAKKQAA